MFSYLLPSHMLLQIGVCMRRIRGRVGMGGPQGQHQVSSSPHDDAILQLCADLHDTDAASMQQKVIKYVSQPAFTLQS